MRLLCRNKGRKIRPQSRGGVCHVQYFNHGMFAGRVLHKLGGRTYATGRPIATKYMTSLSARSKPTTPRPASRVPSNEAIIPSPRSRLPGTPSVGRKPTPINTTNLSSNEESLLSGIRELDKQKEKLHRQKDIAETAQLLRMRMCESQIRELEKQIQAMLTSIGEALAKARFEGRVDFALVPYNLIQSRLLDVAHILASAASEFEKIKQFLMYMIRRQAFHKTEQRITNLEQALVDSEVQFSRITAAIFPRSALRAWYLQEAQAIIRVTSQLKDSNARNAALWDRVDNFASTLMSLVQFIDIRLQPLIPKLGPEHGRLVRQMCDAGHFLAYRFRPGSTSTSRDAWNVPILQIAHRVRLVELNIHKAKHLPDVSFSQRWADSMTARYLWPIYDTAGDIKTMLALTAFTPLSGTSSNNVSHSRQRWRRKFVTLRDTLFSSLRRQQSLIDTFLDFAADGRIMHCPHPDPELHHKQLRAFRPIDFYDTEYENFLKVAQDLFNRVHDVFMQNTPLANENNMRLRRGLLARLDLILHPPEASHPLSRRGNKDTRHRLLVWHSARFLVERVSSTNPVAQASSRTPEPGSVHAPAAPPDVLIGSRTYSQPMSWLTNHTLYPHNRSILIDFVASRATLQQVTDEILQEQIIGLGIIASKEKTFNVAPIKYLIISSQTNVYIMDYGQLQLTQPLYLDHALQRILGNPSILKVGFNTNKYRTLLWMNMGFDLRKTFDVATYSQRLGFDHPAGLSAILEQQFGHGSILGEDLSQRLQFAREKTPAKFFYYLAMCAYAPLRLFCALNRDAVVETTDTRDGFDVVDYFAKHQKLGEDDAELGPVNIDRCHSAFNKATHRYRSHASEDFYSGSRDSFMRGLSMAMARELGSKSHRHSMRGAWATDVAAYYLATAFGENLQQIGGCLGLRSAARLLLEARSQHGLRLNKEDQDKFELVAELTEVRSTSSLPQLDKSTDSEIDDSDETRPQTPSRDNEEATGEVEKDISVEVEPHNRQTWTPFSTYLDRGFSDVDDYEDRMGEPLGFPGVDEASAESIVSAPTELNSTAMRKSSPDEGPGRPGSFGDEGERSASGSKRRKKSGSRRMPHASNNLGKRVVLRNAVSQPEGASVNIASIDTSTKQPKGVDVDNASSSSNTADRPVRQQTKRSDEKAAGKKTDATNTKNTNGTGKAVQTSLPTSNIQQAASGGKRLRIQKVRSSAPSSPPLPSSSSTADVKAKVNVKPAPPTTTTSVSVKPIKPIKPIKRRK